MRQVQKKSQIIQELDSPKEASREILSRLMDEKLVESDKNQNLI